MYNNKLLILGIDSSKRSTGVGLITHTKVDGEDVFEIVAKSVLKTKAFKGEPIFKSEHDSYNMMKHFIADYVEYIDYGVLEGFAFGGQGLTTLAATAAVYQLLLAQNNKPILHVAPNRVKLIVAGSGKASKIEVREGLRKFIKDFDSIKWPTYDVSDAVAIAVASAIVNLYPERFEKKCTKKKSSKPLVKSTP